MDFHFLEQKIEKPVNIQSLWIENCSRQKIVTKEKLIMYGLTNLSHLETKPTTNLCNLKIKFQYQA